MAAVRYYTLILGIVFLLAAICGYLMIGVTPPATMDNLSVHAQHGLLFGLFPVNVLHNTVHLISGLAALACFFAGWRACRAFCQVLGIVYGLVFIMGILPAPFNTTFGLMPIHGLSAWLLHLPIAILSLFFGFAYAERPVTGDTSVTTREPGIYDDEQDLPRHA
jgi:hypothetical protein